MQKQQQRKRRRDGVKEAFWREQLAGQARSGLSVRAFCRQQGLAENSFYAWRRELAVRDREQVAARTAAARPAANQRAAFAEVVVAPAASSATPAIEIILASAGRLPARRISIATGFDPATLAAVLDVLEQRPC